MNRFMGSLLAVAFAVSLAPFATLDGGDELSRRRNIHQGLYQGRWHESLGLLLGTRCEARGCGNLGIEDGARCGGNQGGRPQCYGDCKGCARRDGNRSRLDEQIATSTTKSAAGATSCPPGKTYVNGYTKANGTKVAGYCRSAPSK